MLPNQVIMIKIPGWMTVYKSLYSSTSWNIWARCLLLVINKQIWGGDSAVGWGAAGMTYYSRHYQDELLQLNSEHSSHTLGSFHWYSFFNSSAKAASSTARNASMMWFQLPSGVCLNQQSNASVLRASIFSFSSLISFSLWCSMFKFIINWTSLSQLILLRFLRSCWSVGLHDCGGGSPEQNTIHSVIILQLRRLHTWICWTFRHPLQVLWVTAGSNLPATHNNVLCARGPTPGIPPTPLTAELRMRERLMAWSRECHVLPSNPLATNQVVKLADPS